MWNRVTEINGKNFNKFDLLLESYCSKSMDSGTDQTKNSTTKNYVISNVFTTFSVLRKIWITKVNFRPLYVLDVYLSTRYKI